MELISEEELSVCRSEGSPPRKNKKRKTEANETNNAGGAIVDMNNSQATAVLRNPTIKGPSTSGKPTSKKSVANQKTGSHQSSNQNFRIRPERVNRLSSAQISANQTTDNLQEPDGGAGSKVMTMSAMLKNIKKKQQEASEGEDSDSANNDEDSSCGKSFSGDELSEGDLKDVQGDILGAIKRFDDIYNRGGVNKDKISRDKPEPRKPKKTVGSRDNQAKETEKRKPKVKREELMNAAKNA